MRVSARAAVLAIAVLSATVVGCKREKGADTRVEVSRPIEVPRAVLAYIGLKNPQSTIDDVLAVHEALLRLARLDPRGARIVEMRFFSGLTEAEIASELGASERWVREQWSHARAWLRRELGRESDRP